MKEPRRRTDYGSVLRADDGTYWYTCGVWRLRDFPEGIPGILAYAPIGPEFPLKEGQKTLEVDGVTLVKVSNQPLDVYRTVYLPAVADLIGERRFGRLVFLDERRVTEIRCPRRHTPAFVAKVVPEGERIAELCRRLGVSLDDVGIWGSTLMFREPVRRHEVDVVIHGKEQSRRAYDQLTGGRIPTEDLVLDPGLGLCTVFRYRGVEIDLFFDPGEAVHHLDGAGIRLVRQLENEVMTIEGTAEALFYPAVYESSNGRRLISFRPAHARCFFRRGWQIRFDSISVVEIDRPDGTTETAYAVLNYERAERL